MGETAVIFTAMVGVLLLLARGPRQRRVLRDGRWVTVEPETTGEGLDAGPGTEGEGKGEGDDG